MIFLKKIDKRNTGADIIRIVALIQVISIHFISNAGYYSNIMRGSKMLIWSILRASFRNCVPLFMMLSGYLLCKKKVETNYSGLIKTIAIYVIANVFYIAVNLRKGINIQEAVAGIFNYSTIPISWYVEMYIGLFC